ncbi:MAG: PLP-dependent aminotransferase family protein [Clostridiales bacterium]|nr:PLP-dependent aminotransferase family protein [Clostridiales bacterium]
MAVKETYEFSKKIAGLKPSAVREILKSTSDPEVISLAAGNPAPDAFPVESISKIAGDIFREDPISALQYGITEGYPPLRDGLKTYLKNKYNMGADYDELIVTSGATQIMELLTKVLCNEGDCVACEDPSFIGSLNCFRSYGVKLCGVPMESDGLDVAALEKMLSSCCCKVKFLYTIPNFQNPTGYTMSLEKRKKLYELASEYDIIILEDNPYGDLRVSGEDLPTIKSFDTEGRVVYAGTFSKLIAPGIRVGYVLGPAALVSKMTVGKQTEDVHTAMFNQMLVYRWMKENDINEHISRMQSIYREKLNVMCDALDEYCPKLEYVKPEGGMFVWCRLPEGVDMLGFCKTAAAHKVAVVPGTAFLPDETASTQYIRLNFSTPTNEDMVKGIKILGELLS